MKARSQLRVVVVILNWNGKEATLDCLDSVYKSSYHDPDVIVVDNGSNDGTVTAVRRNFPVTKILENSVNLGYAEGNNVGLKYALDHKADYAFVLNNDTIVASDCISGLVADMECHLDAAAAAPKSYYFDAPEMIYFAGGRISQDGRVVHLGSGKRDGVEFSSPTNTEWLTGCAILFRSEALRKVGLFDPRYYLLFEDADWSSRAKRVGYQLRIVPAAKLWHKISPSFVGTWSPPYLYYYTRNNLLWVERNFPWSLKPRYYRSAVKRAFEEARQGVVARSDDGVRRKKAVWQGIADYMLRKFGEQPLWR